MSSSLALSFGLALAGCSANTPSPEVPPAAPPAASVAPPSATPPPTAAAPAPAPAAAHYECTVVLGLTVTNEWYNAGFEQLVPDAEWEALVKPHTFVRDWGDPNHAVWSEATLSPCAARAKSPDRALFFAADWKYADEAEWKKGLTQAIATIRSKFPELKRLELLSMVRGPKNASCGDPKSVIEPMVDAAIAAVVEPPGGVVQAGPKFEVSDCAAFTKGGPHFSDEGGKQVAKLVSAHYAAAASAPAQP